MFDGFCRHVVFQTKHGAREDSDVDVVLCCHPSITQQYLYHRYQIGDQEGSNGELNVSRTFLYRRATPRCDAREALRDLDCLTSKSIKEVRGYCIDPSGQAIPP